jgi:hypothetical protein
MSTGRPQWFADVVRAGLDTALFAETDVLRHIPPAVLVAEMPPEVVVDVLGKALDAGSISPKSVLATVTPELLAEHVAHKLLWECIAEAADKAGVPRGDGAAATDGAREFLRRAIDRGLANGVMPPKQIIGHVTAAVLGHSFPDALKTKLLEVTLASGKMTPEIVIETLGVEAIARHAPTKVLWACLAETAGTTAGMRMDARGEIAADRAVTVPAADKLASLAPPAARLEVVDDDVLDALTVDIDEALSSVEVKPPAPAKTAPPPMAAKPVPAPRR